MTTPIELWQTAAAAFEERHNMVEASHLPQPTPCDGFDIAALIDHAVGTQVHIASLLGVEIDGEPSWPLASDAMAAALSVAGVFEGTFEHPGLGPTSGERLAQIATHDLLIHTWDLSRGLGVDDALPQANLEPAIASIEAFPEVVREALFADPIKVDADATSQARMLAVAGREA